MVDGKASAAFENARDIISAERSMHLFFEQDFQEWALSDARWSRAGAQPAIPDPLCGAELADPTWHHAAQAGALAREVTGIDR